MLCPTPAILLLAAPVREKERQVEECSFPMLTEAVGLLTALRGDADPSATSSSGVSDTWRT
jgi:hypothetical protein